MLWCVPPDDAIRQFFETAGLDLEVAEPEQGLELAAEESFDAVVGHWTDRWRKLLSRLERQTTFIHVGEELPTSLVEFVTAGGSGWSASNVVQACERLALVAPHRHARRTQSHDIEVLLEACAAPVELLDCSSTGLAFLIPGNTPLERFAEGAVHEDLRLVRGGTLVLKGVVAVRTLVAQGPGFRVGCEFQRKDSNRYAPVDRRREDPLRSLALFSRIAKVSAVTLSAEHGAPLVMKGATVDAATRRMVFEKGSTLAPFDIVDCSAHLDDARFEWRASVVTSDPLVLQLPVRVLESLRRNPVRRAPLRSSRLRFTHPLSGEVFDAPVADFTPSGVQVTVRDLSEAFPPGLRLAGASLTLDGLELTVDADVRHRDKASLGLELQFADDRAQRQLARTWVMAASPHVVDGQKLPFDDIFAFCTKAGLVNEEVAATFAPLKPAARETQARLGEDDGRLFNALISRGAEEMQGYLSAFRTYHHTWYVQHMAATAAGTRAAFDLNRAMGELCERAPDAHYFQLAYYVDNPWPARVFGGFARRVDSGGAALKVRTFQRLRNDSTWLDTPTPHCREATERDATVIVSVVARSEPSLVLQAMDFDASRLWLKGLDDAWKRIGLQRSRTGLVYVREGRCLGVALCELGPVGVNFRELASTARLYFHHELSEQERANASRELTAACGRHYKALGRPFTLLADASTIDADALSGAPFQLAELTARKELLRDFKRLLRLSSAMVARRRRAAGPPAAATPSEPPK